MSFQPAWPEISIGDGQPRARIDTLTFELALSSSMSPSRFSARDRSGGHMSPLSAEYCYLGPPEAYGPPLGLLNCFGRWTL